MIACSPCGGRSSQFTLLTHETQKADSGEAAGLWINCNDLNQGQVHVSFVVLLSATVQFVVPGGDCKEADPA